MRAEEQRKESGRCRGKSASAGLRGIRIKSCAAPVWHGMSSVYCMKIMIWTKREAEDLLDFVAMATVCDVMSLTGENRILVKRGIKENPSYEKHRIAGTYAGMQCTAGEYQCIPFWLCLRPCVNATGRLDTARHALRLFETGQETEAEEIARDLVDLNQERKELTLQGVEMAKETL